MADPPFVEGAPKVRRIVPEERVAAAKLVGALGTVQGTTAVELDDHVIPTELLAPTRKT
jgi:hypothetical protein